MDEGGITRRKHSGSRALAGSRGSRLGGRGKGTTAVQVLSGAGCGVLQGWCKAGGKLGAESVCLYTSVGYQAR